MSSMLDIIDELLKTNNRPMSYYPDQVVCGSTGNRVYASFSKKPGLCGIFHFIHKTDLTDLITLRFTNIENAIKLKTEYEWMPSHLSMCHVYPNFEIIEKKFITQNDLLVSEITVQSKSGPVKLRIQLKSEFLNSQFEADYTAKFGQRVLIKALCTDNELLYGKNIEVGPNNTYHFSIACAFITAGEKYPDVIPTLAQHRIEYGKFYDQIPKLTCSDKKLEKVYYYRWYLLRHHIAQPGIGNIQHPIFYEGRYGYFKEDADDPIEWEFSRGVLASAPLQLLDMRWHNDLSYVEGEIKNFTEHLGRMQPFLSYKYNRPLLPGCIRINDFTGHYFFHLLPYAAWVIYESSQNIQWLKDVASVLWEDLKSWDEFDNGCFLPEMIYEGDSAMEFGPASHCYRANDCPESSEDLTIGEAIHYKTQRASWGKPFSTRRTEVATFYGLNYFAFYHIFSILQDRERSDLCLAKYESIKRAIEVGMWNSKTSYFHELRKDCSQIEEVKQVGGLFCLFLANPQDPETFLRNLNDSSKFKLKYGIPSVSKDSFGYFPNNSVAGHVTHTCLWNGPSWPYSTSYALLALGSYINRVSDTTMKRKYEEYFKEEFFKYTEQHFLLRDKSVPCIVEHYNPETGAPLSGQDDYNHSAYIDIIIRMVCGFNPSEGGTIDFSPINIGVESLTLENILYKKERYTILIDKTQAVLKKNNDILRSIPM